MIREQKTITIGEMARVCSQLVEAKAFYQSQALYYHSMFLAHCVPPETRLPNSPLVEFFQKMTQIHIEQVFIIERRLSEWQGIADSTMFADLDY